MKKFLCTLAATCLVTGFGVAQNRYYLGDGHYTDKLNLPETNGFPKQVGTNASINTQPFAPQKMISGDVPYKFFNFDIPDDEINFYAFQFHAIGSLYYRGVLHQTTNNLDYRNFLAEWPGYGGYNTGEYIIEAGCMVGDEYWAYISMSEFMGYIKIPVGIYNIDLRTGLLGRCLYDHSFAQQDYNWTLQEMSYDPKTNYVYGVQRRSAGWLGTTNTSVMNVVRIDPDDPSVDWTVIGEVDYHYTMACDNGYMYFFKKKDEITGFDDEGYPIHQGNYGIEVYRINLEENTNFDMDDCEYLGLLNHGFIKMEYNQTMEFDHTTHTLWWAGMKDDATPFMTRVNLDALETDEELRARPTDSQYFGMAIPYEVVEDDAPSFIKGLKYQTADLGEEKVDFSWTNPSTNYQLGNLSSLDGIRVLRDGDLLVDLKDVTAGEKMELTDDKVLSGVHTYTFIPYNETGDGLTRQRVMFIGRDTPGAVTDIEVKTDGTHAELSWNIAARGTYNGWYDKESQKFTVIRYPDYVTIAEDITEPRCSDDVDEYRGYYYEIIPMNADGEGVHAMSKVYPYGNPLEVPYANAVDDAETANMFTIVDANNDGVSWNFTRSLSDGKSCFMYSRSLSDADDYLILPNLVFDPAKKYEVRFQYATSNYMDTEELLEVRQGKLNTANTQSTILNSIPGYPINSALYLDGQAYVEDPSLGTYLSFHAASKGDQGWICIKDVVVREYSATDVSVHDFNGGEYAYIGSENPYRILVHNDGYAAVDNAVARIVDAKTNTVLAETAVGRIEKNETKDVVVLWNPATAGKYSIYANVQLEGDTYEADNTFDTTIEVEVTEGQASQWLDVLKKIQTGWKPIYTSRGHSHMETIYFANEIGLSKIMLTGLVYFYEMPESYNGDMGSIPVKVYLGTTDETVTEVGKFFDSSIFTKVYDGELDLRGTKRRNDATMMFDTEFFYPEGKNLVIKVVADCEPTSDNCNWYIYDEQDKWNAFSEGMNLFRSVSSTDEEKISVNDQVPVIRLGYRDASGVEGVISVNDKLEVAGNSIIFSGVQTEINIFDLSGKQVANVKNSNRVSGLDKGIYTVVARKGADFISTKVVIK